MEGTSQGLTQDQLDATGKSEDAALAALETEVKVKRQTGKAEPIRLLSRDDIIGVTDMKYEVVHVPEWGGHVRVRGLRAVERDEYEASMVKQRGKNVDVNIGNIRAGLVARAICDEHGNRIFKDADIVLLGQKSAAALERVYEVAARLATIDDSAVVAMAGNSASDRSGEPSSA